MASGDGIFIVMKVKSAIVISLIIFVSGVFILKRVYFQPIIVAKQSLPRPVIVAESNQPQHDIYQYTDEHGNVVLTNHQHKSGHKIELPPLVVYATEVSKDDITAQSYTQYSLTRMLGKNNIPNATTNKGEAIANLNDTNRRVVLNEELVHEKLALTKAMSLLSAAKLKNSHDDGLGSYSERIKLLTDDVTEHQKNIELLNQSLAVK